MIFVRLTRDFVAGQAAQIAEILCVFQSLRCDEMPQKIRQSGKKQFFHGDLQNAVNSIPEQRRGEAIGLPDRFEEAA